MVRKLCVFLSQPTRPVLRHPSSGRARVYQDLSGLPRFSACLSSSCSPASPCDVVLGRARPRCRSPPPNNWKSTQLTYFASQFRQPIGRLPSRRTSAHVRLPRQTTLRGPAAYQCIADPDQGCIAHRRGTSPRVGKVVGSSADQVAARTVNSPAVLTT